MSDEELDEFMELSNEEQEKYYGRVLKQETPNYLEEFARLYRKYGELKFVIPEDQILINYGGREFARTEFFLRGLMTAKEYINE